LGIFNRQIGRDRVIVLWYWLNRSYGISHGVIPPSAQILKLDCDRAVAI
jgi:hypothetical protein